MERVIVPPELIRWARKRAGLSAEELRTRMPRLILWERGEAAPTMRQLEELAQKTNLWLGFFFLPWAPSPDLEIADFRSDQDRRPPSPALLETVHLCRLRQHWYHEQALLKRMKPLKFIGCKGPGDSVVEVAESIRATVNLQPGPCHNPERAAASLEALIEQVEGARILVMRGGVASEPVAPGAEDPEFRGLVLSDTHAPLIYLDATDAIASQIFTLTHELAHLWLGVSGISNPRDTLVADARAMETFCNRVAAEALVPLSAFRDAWDNNAGIETECARLATRFCVSPLIILRRAYDAGFLDSDVFHTAYRATSARLDRAVRITGVGAAPLTPMQRVGRRFGEALAAAVQSHRVDEHEAMGLLGASMPEEVWLVCGSHDECIDEDFKGIPADSKAQLAGVR